MIVRHGSTQGQLLACPETGKLPRCQNQLGDYRVNQDRRPFGHGFSSANTKR
jgi:hypothetical protein